MKVLFGLKDFGRISRPVVTLGVFDGLHRGHLEVLRHVIRTARRIKGTSVVITFYPHPQHQKSLYSLKHRIRLLEEVGIDVCLVVKFTKTFSKISPLEFVENFLVTKIHPSHIFIGENFTFGKDALGNASLLQKYAHIYNFKLTVFPVTKSGAKAISSTHIRSLISRGNLNVAQRLLGRRVSILGRVIKGSGLGVSLGFPTANINPHHEVIPPSGVYAVKVNLDNNILPGICYIGTKPTFKIPNSKFQIPNKVHIEVHILEFKKDIYRKDLEVQFIKKIRPERRFASKELLKEQIQKDILIARRILHHNISAS